ncbi:hypothetical protein Mgra_00004566 [Meloidogyne graminicola]|uniref:Uncharacterized protein n=1 Tax=Meloidogyne graminicola TaxID=189291 RepID=A0A8S9ZRU2_9BILA|nr:hypothetical protein Mgra_00004566 [Meloidogyne graminicola]
MDKSVKDSKFKNKGKQCEEDCNDDISSKTVGKIETNKDVVVQVGNKDLSKKCCNKQNYLGVVITAMLAFSGMQNIANVSNLQNTFDCKIYPNNIFNNYMPSCNLVYNCSSTTTCCPDHYICGTNKMYLQVKSKDFHNYIDNDQPFKMYCPVGNSGEDVLVAEGYGNCDVEVKDKCEIVLGEITN